MNKNILITGGLGHIGSHFIRNMPEYNITVVDNLSTQRYASLFNLPDNITFIEGSFSELKPDDLKPFRAVIHLAALTDATASVENPEKTWWTNTFLTNNFIDVCSWSAPKLFIFPSSTSVYGKGERIMHEDGDNTDPQSPYADSKLEVERKLRGISERHLGHCILRFGTIFGTSPGMRFHTAINKFCWQTAMGVDVTVWKQNFRNQRPYLGLNDALQAVKLVLDEPLSWNNTYNVVSENARLVDIVHNLQSSYGARVNFVDQPILNQNSYFVPCERMREMGFVAKDKIAKGIQDTMECLINVNRK